MKLTKYLFPLIAITTIGLLSGCAENSSNVEEKKTVNSSSNESETETLPLSKALPRYEIWYRFSSNELTKESFPTQIFYFDGKKVESYYLRDFTDEFVGIDEYEELSISQLLDMKKDEQLKYAKKISHELINTATYTEWWSGSDVDKEQNIGSVSEDAITDYQLNIVTDGSGNNSSAEEVFAVYYFIQEKGGNISWQLSDKSRYSLIQSSISRIPIYDHFLSGYICSRGGEESLFLTDIGDDNVFFTLDTPSDKSSIITVDKKDEEN